MSETLNFTNTPDFKPVLYTKNTHSNVNEQTSSQNQTNSQNFTSPTFILLKKPLESKLCENSNISLNNNNSTTNINTTTQNYTNEINSNDLEENSSTPPPPEGNEIDDFILKLLHGNDRLTVLKLDSELEKFMRDPNATRLEFPPMSSYQRLIVHRVAQYFKLDHPSIDLGGQKRSVILTKNKESRTPALRLCDLVEHQEEPAPSKSVKILSRKNSSNNSPLENPVILHKNTPPSVQKSQSNTQLEASDSSVSSPSSSLEEENRLNSKSLEEREAEYLKARARIFKDDPNNSNIINSNTNNSTNISTNNITNNNNNSSTLSPSLSHSLSNPLPQNLHLPNPNLHSPPIHHHPHHVNVHHPPPDLYYAVDKEKETLKKDLKTNNMNNPRQKIIIDKQAMNMNNNVEYPPDPMSPWVNNMWTHPSDFSSVDPRSWDKLPKYPSVPIPESPYLVPHSDPDQYPVHYDKRDHHHSNPNLINNPNPPINPNYNVVNHPKPRYNHDNIPINNSHSNTPTSFQHGANDNHQYVYYESPVNLWPNYYGNFYPPNQLEPIYNPHFYAPRQVQSLPQLRRDYERPPPKSTHLFDPNAPQSSYNPPRVENQNYYTNNYGNYNTPIAKTPTPKQYYTQPKIKPSINNDNFATDKPVTAHILEIVGVESNVSCDSEIFQDIRSSGANIKLLEDNTLIAIFKNSTIAKFAMDNVRSNHFSLQAWSKN